MRKVGCVVAPLILLHQEQRSLCIKDRSGQHARQQQPHLIERQRRCSLFPLQSYPNQEMMRQHYQYHMMMPALPRAHLIVFHPDFLLSLLKRQLHWPAHPQKARQFRLPRRFGRIARVLAYITGLCRVPTYDQPQARAWQSVSCFRHAHHGYIAHYRPFAAFLHHHTKPPFSGMLTLPSSTSKHRQCPLTCSPCRDSACRV